MPASDRTATTVYFDDEIASVIQSVIESAKQRVILVTPWIEMWRHIRDSLSMALRRGVDITVVVRLEDALSDNRDIRWLVEHGARVVAVENLHAKIYLNEQSVVASSMNILEHDLKNSKEFALVVRDRSIQRRLREYVTKTLLPLSVRVETLLTKERSVSHA